MRRATATSSGPRPWHPSDRARRSRAAPDARRRTGSARARRRARSGRGPRTAGGRPRTRTRARARLRERSRTVKPSSAARSRSSRRSADLPIPAGPSTTNALPSPPAAASSSPDACRRSDSRSRSGEPLTEVTQRHYPSREVCTRTLDAYRYPSGIPAARSASIGIGERLRSSHQAALHRPHHTDRQIELDAAGSPAGAESHQHHHHPGANAGPFDQEAEVLPLGVQVVVEAHQALRTDVRSRLELSAKRAHLGVLGEQPLGPLDRLGAGVPRLDQLSDDLDLVTGHASVSRR